MWGIRTLGMLAALPEKELIARMGQDAKQLRQLALGELPHLFQPIDVPFVLEERVELDFPLEDLESLLFDLSVMLEQLILRAKVRIVALGVRYRYVASRWWEFAFPNCSAGATDQ